MDKLVASLFNVVDADGSGCLEADEGKRFFCAAGCVAREVDYYWQDILRTADANHDGRISKEEFEDFCAAQWSDTRTQHEPGDRVAAALAAQQAGRHEERFTDRANVGDRGF